MKKRKKTITISILILLALVGGGFALNGYFGGRVPSDTFTRGLVGYWSFDEGRGSIVYDISGNAKNASSKGQITDAFADYSKISATSSVVVSGGLAKLEEEPQCYSGGEATTTDWGAGLYGCGIADDDKRCYDGTCHDCSDTGGYLYADGCSGCAGQGGEACWRGGTTYQSCTTVCGSYGGCVGANWNDSTSCTVCQAILGGTCWVTPSTGSYAPYRFIGFNRCYYRHSNFAQSCAGKLIGTARVCVCAY